MRRHVLQIAGRMWSFSGTARRFAATSAAGPAAGTRASARWAPRAGAPGWGTVGCEARRPCRRAQQ